MRRTLLTTSAVAAGAWALPAPSAHLPALADALQIARTADVGPGTVGLTFDDGPHPQATPAVLDVLARYGASATFFVVGEQVDRHPGIIEEIVAAGHRLAVHGDRHVCQLRRTPHGLAADIARCAARVRDIQPGPITHWRAPYGVFSPAGLAIGRRLGWQPLLWSRWGRDWTARATAESIAGRVTEGAVVGDVLLLHDSDAYGAAGCWRATVAALPRILDRLGTRGLCVRAV